MTRQDDSYGIFITDNNPMDKYNSMFDVLSAIQHYYVAESKGNEINENFLTIKGELNFFIVGFKIALLIGALELILIPFFWCTIYDYIPIFGTTSNWLDKAIAFVLTNGFSVGLLLMLLLLGRFYIGRVTRLVIKSLYKGITTGVLLKTIMVFIFFHMLYFKWITPTTLYYIYTGLSKLFNVRIVNNVSLFLINLRTVLIPSSYYIIFLSVITLLIPAISIFIVSRKAIEKKKLENEAWN